MQQFGTRSYALRLALAIVLCAGAAPALAQSYPAKPVKFIVAGPPAGGTDYLTRLLADKLSEAWKQPVVVENRAGASGIIGTNFVKAAAADGYTIMMGHSATHAIVPAMHDPQPYDAVRDFTPVTLVATAPEVLVVAADSPIKTVQDLLATAKARPDELTYGSPGIGLPQHLLGYLLGKTAGVSIRHVPYKGSAPALTDLIGGRISMMFVTPPAVMPFIKDSRVRALAITSPQRSAALPNVPTLAELGMPNLSQSGWFGVFAPAHTPPQVVAKISGEIAKILALPEIRAKIDAQYAEPVGNTPEQFAAFHAQEVQKWAAIVKESGVRAEQ